jgi:hypothetical protein
MGNRDSFPGVSRSGRQADGSSPSSAEAKNVSVFMTKCLIKHRDKFAFSYLCVFRDNFQVLTYVVALFPTLQKLKDIGVILNACILLC